MADILHPDLYDGTRPVGSWWEASLSIPPVVDAPLTDARDVEVAIIGGGYAGLSCALHLAEAGVEAVVLEAGPYLGWGASGRNAGMCCLGGAFQSYATLARRFGGDEVRRFIDAQRQAVALVGDLAVHHGFDVERQGAGELAIAHTPSAMEDLTAHQAEYRDLAGYATELWSRGELAERHHRSPDSFGALFLPGSFGLNPLKYAQGLAAAVRAAGVGLHAGSRVTTWTRQPDGRHRLGTAGGTVSARRVVMATNAFTPEHLHAAFGGAYMPILSQVAVTRPLTPGELADYGYIGEEPGSDTRHRLTDVRILPADAQGGRRLLLAAAGGISGAEDDQGRWTAHIQKRLKRKFPLWAEVEITHSWRGPWCITSSLMPNVGRLADDPSVYHAIGFQGVGVSLATYAGRAVAWDIVDRAGRAPLPAIMSQPPKRFPLAPWRLLGQRLVQFGFDVRDGFT